MKYMLVTYHGYQIIDTDLNQPGTIEKLMAEQGIKQWVADYTTNPSGSQDLGYEFDQGMGMLLTFQAIIPEPVEKVTEWRLPEQDRWDDD